MIRKILSTVHLQTEPLGKPALEVGMLLMDRLLTNVAHARSAVMLLPTIIAELHELVLLVVPPKIDE